MVWSHFCTVLIRLIDLRSSHSLAPDLLSRLTNTDLLSSLSIQRRVFYHNRVLSCIMVDVSDKAFSLRRLKATLSPR